MRYAAKPPSAPNLHHATHPWSGADPCVWTAPPSGAGPYQPGDEEDFASYDQVTKSEVYRLLKELLPTQAAFP